MSNVVGHLLGVEGFESRQNGDPLAQLDQVWTQQAVGERRLTGKNDLHELRARGFEIRPLPYGLQHRLRKVLRLVDHHNDPPAASRLLHQDLIQALAHPCEALTLVVYLQVRHQGFQQLARIGRSTKQENCTRRFPHLLQYLKQEGSFSHSRRGHERHEPASNFDSVGQRSQRLTMRRAQVQVARIRGHAERLFAQAVKIKHHSSRPVDSHHSSDQE